MGASDQRSQDHLSAPKLQGKLGKEVWLLTLVSVAGGRGGGILSWEIPPKILDGHKNDHYLLRTVFTQSLSV